MPPDRQDFWGAVFGWERLNPSGFPGNVCLDNVIDPVLSDEHWFNPRTPV